MRFPLWERLEMAPTWAFPMALIAFITPSLLVEVRVAAVAAGVIVLGVGTVFVTLRRLPVTGGRGWLTYAGLAVVTFAAGGGGLVVEPARVRSTRVNLLGRRTVPLPHAERDASG